MEVSKLIGRNYYYACECSAVATSDALLVKTCVNEVFLCSEFKAINLNQFPDRQLLIHSTFI